MSKRFFALTVVAGLVAAIPFVTAADDKKTGMDGEGFIKEWVILAPIPLADGDDPGEAVTAKEQLKDEAKLAPKDGDKAKAGDKELVWKKVACDEHFFDFNKVLGDQTERSVGYAVTYVTADADKEATLKIGSDDGFRLWVNGKEVGKGADDRALDKDQDTFEKVALKKGVNVLVFKIVNNGGEWSGCARFVDKDDKPVAGLTAAAAK